MMWRIVLLAVVFMLVASGATGEYYKYTDENGNARFTDDMTQIPEDQRESVESFASEAGASDGTQFGNASLNQEAVYASETDEYVQEYAAPAGDTFETRASELNEIQATLNNTRRALEEERAELAAQSPGEDANNNEKIAYRAKVDALNVKIEKYSRDLKAFEDKVDAFNNRGRAQEPE